MLNTNVERADDLMAQAIAHARREMTRSMGIDHTSQVLISTDATREENPLIAQLVEECLGRSAKVRIHQRNLPLTAELLNSAEGIEAVKADAEEFYQMNVWANKVMIIRASENEDALNKVDPQLRKIYSDGYDRANQVRLQKRWILTVYPTEDGARKEGYEFQEFKKIIFNSWCQPWAEIKAAQAKLITMLDAGEHLRIISNPNSNDSLKRSDLSMSIKGMTFINSAGSAGNFPGAEVYSAPLRESVEGQFFAPGLFQRGIRDISLTFRKGEVVAAQAAQGQESLDEILSENPANRFVGEIGIGNNPALWQPFIKALYCEKRAGSVHIALGHCYSHTESDGRFVNVNNHNTGTKLHWDITVSMVPQFGGGRIILDDKVIQENGKWCDEELRCLWPR